MNKTHFQSFLFALVVIVLTFVGRGESSDFRFDVETYAQNNFEEDALALADEAFERAQSNQREVTPLSMMLQPEQANQVTRPPVGAEIGLLKEIGSPFMLYEKASSRVWPLASLTKLMTAVVAIEQIGLDTLITISDRAVLTEGVSGDFTSGELFSVRDLIRAAIGISSNDAAYALAEFYGEEEFVNRMQIKASELGMYQTSFYDPIGLSVLNQSSAYDIEKLVQYIYVEHPFIFEISRSPSVTITDHVSGKTRVIFNNNEFAGMSGFIGGKTGFTDEAQGNLVSVFAEGNSFLMTVILGSQERFQDTERLLEWFQQSFSS